MTEPADDPTGGAGTNRPPGAGAWGSRSGPARRSPARDADVRPPDPPFDADADEPVPRDAHGRVPRYGDEPAPEGYDTVAVLAVAVGVAGLFAFGLGLAIVAGVLGATAGQRARESGRSFTPAYLAFALAVADGAVWIVLHLLFELPVQIG